MIRAPEIGLAWVAGSLTTLNPCVFLPLVLGGAVQGNRLAPVAMGAGMVWSPCSGPILAGALTIVATEGGALRGTLILGLFGLGAATILVGAAYASRAGFGRVHGWVLTHMDRVKRGFRVLVLLLGVAILSGGDKWLEAQPLQVMPQGWIDLTTRF